MTDDFAQHLGDALRARAGAASQWSPSVSSIAAIPIASGPSDRFVKLTRNPELPRPARFEPTVKREGDVVL